MSVAKPKNSLKYDDISDIVDVEIEKRRHKWNLSSVPAVDYDDVAQIIRAHIAEKLWQYDETLPIKPWLNRIISNQRINVIRNIYGAFAKPCQSCCEALPNDGCGLFNKQCDVCPLYKKWNHKGKRDAYETKIPLALENHLQQAASIPAETLDIEKSEINVHARMRSILIGQELEIYILLYINHEPENKVAKLLGFKSKEKGRQDGYKRLNVIKKSIIDKVKAEFKAQEIEYVY